MKFEEVLPALRAGKKIREKSWKEDTYFYRNPHGFYKTKSGDDDYDYYSLTSLLITYLLDSDDWEIIG